MHHDASPPETLPPLILRALARPLRSGPFFVGRARRLCYTAAMVSVCRSRFACLACALWFLWAAPPLTGQQAVLSGQDAQFFDAYRRSDPITNWPLKKTVNQIPELYGVKPATDQSQLPGILHRISANLQKFVLNFVDTTCLETVEETGNLPRGLVGPDAWGDERCGYGGTTERAVQKFRYLMLARRGGSTFTLVELRTDPRGREAPTQKLLSKQYVKTTGFASDAPLLRAAATALV